MRIEKLRAENYRNIKEAEIEFSPGINLLTGGNAEGKTNVLEAIYSYARGRSFRGASDGELTKIGEDGFFTELTFSDFERSQTLSYRYYKGVRQRKINGAPVEKMAEMMGLFRAVLFFPEHLMLVKGGPCERRNFLDIAISQCRPVYIRHLTRYKNILEQRNALLRDSLKNGRTDFDSLSVWSDNLAAAAAEINVMRRSYIKALSVFADEILGELSGGREKIELVYDSDIEEMPLRDAAQRYREIFSENILRETMAGCTLFGTHRDDMKIIINTLDSRLYASQGQQRSVVLALKLAEGEMSREMTGEYPVFLFDDVLSELDGERRKFVVGKKGERQVIITSCEESDFVSADARVISVKGGKYVSSYR